MREFDELEQRQRPGRHLLEADLADGESDGGLDPSLALPGEDRPTELPPLPGAHPPPRGPVR